MYRNEILFVENFLASLKKLDVTDIPFENEKFKNGIESMNKYFYDNIEKTGKYSDEISLLFIKSPIEGSYDEISNAMLNLNGRLVSFALANPYYEKATISLVDDEADYILDKNNIDIDKSTITNFAREFCTGAEIKINK